MERVEPLRRLLGGDDLFNAYQATLVLTAWGDPVGFDSAAKFIDGNIHEVEMSAPHRMHGGDMVYDQLAEAVSIGFHKVDGQLARSFTAKLLERFPQHCFRSGIRALLWCLEDGQLLPVIIAALHETLRNNNYSQASDLLPAIARLDPGAGWQAVNLFRAGDTIRPEAAGKRGQRLGIRSHR